MKSMFAPLALVVSTIAIVDSAPLRLIDIPVELPEFSLDVSRNERFPSREERIKLYMSNWYVPPCLNHVDGFVQYHVSTETVQLRWPTYIFHEPRDQITNSSSFSKTYEVESIITPDKLFWMDRGTVLDCSIRGKGAPMYASRIPLRSNMHMYCEDVERLLLPALDHIAWESHQQSSSILPESIPPILLQFGDLPHSHVYRFVTIPHFKKFRLAATSAELDHVIYDKNSTRACYDFPRYPLISDVPLQPVVWKLASHRHYGLLNQVAIKDKPWEEKKNMAVFRGQLTGSLGYDKDAPPVSNCLKLSRCRLVYNHANSTLVNARLTSTRNRLPEKVNGVTLTTSSVTVRHLLRYKGIVMLEGNDVASGLKWALLSNSVVLMPIPKHTSWAMEELLKPWVHYVPLNDEATDVEEKMQWILDHDDAARKISYAATLWMQDLVYHPDAVEDDRWIQEEMIRRYQMHFLHMLSHGIVE
jgi:Glycosyl transferase family 90